MPKIKFIEKLSNLKCNKLTKLNPRYFIVVFFILLFVEIIFIVISLRLKKIIWIEC